MKSGYLLLSPEQRAEMDNLKERCTIKVQCVLRLSMQSRWLSMKNIVLG